MAVFGSDVVKVIVKELGDISRNMFLVIGTLPPRYRAQVLNLLIGSVFVTALAGVILHSPLVQVA